MNFLDNLKWSNWILVFILFSERDKFARSLADADDISEERNKLAFVCSCAVDAVKADGSVLIPIDRLGTVLQLLEEISTSLDSSNLKVATKKDR